MVDNAKVNVSKMTISVALDRLDTVIAELYRCIDDLSTHVAPILSSLNNNIAEDNKCCEGVDESINSMLLDTILYFITRVENLITITHTLNSRIDL